MIYIHNNNNNNYNIQKYAYWTLSFALVASLAFVNLWYIDGDWLMVMNASMFITFILIKLFYKYIKCLKNIRFRIFAIPFLAIVAAINIVVITNGLVATNNSTNIIILAVDLFFILCELLFSLYILLEDNHSDSNRSVDDLLVVVIMLVFIVMTCFRSR